MITEVQTAQNVWPLLREVVFVPHAQSEYQRLTEVLDNLIDVVGEIESACKHVVAERCKQAGMRWSKTGINAILFWRCLLKNHTWDTYWDTQGMLNAA